MVSSMRRFSQSEVAQERLKIINYYSRYGERATKEAFGVGRKTIVCLEKETGFIPRKDHISCSLINKTNQGQTNDGKSKGI